MMYRLINNKDARVTIKLGKANTPMVFEKGSSKMMTQEAYLKIAQELKPYTSTGILSVTKDTREEAVDKEVKEDKKATKKVTKKASKKEEVKVEKTEEVKSDDTIVFEDEEETK